MARCDLWRAPRRARVGDVHAVVYQARYELGRTLRSRQQKKQVRSVALTLRDRTGLLVEGQRLGDCTHKCGMGVNMTCAKCGTALVNDSLTKADGGKVQTSKCPNGRGKIKSPLCCGQDMSCAV